MPHGSGDEIVDAGPAELISSLTPSTKLGHSDSVSKYLAAINTESSARSPALTSVVSFTLTLTTSDKTLIETFARTSAQPHENVLRALTALKLYIAEHEEATTDNDVKATLPQTELANLATKLEGVLDKEGANYVNRAARTACGKTGGHGSIGCTLSILRVVRGRVADSAIVWGVALHPIPDEGTPKTVPAPSTQKLGYPHWSGAQETDRLGIVQCFLRIDARRAPAMMTPGFFIPGNIAIPPHLILAPGAVQVPIHQSNIHPVPAAVLVMPVLVPPAPAILFDWIKKQFPPEIRATLSTMFKMCTGGKAPSVGLGPGDDPVETLADILTFATGKNEEEPPEWTTAQDECKETEEQQSPGNKEYPTDPMVYFMEQMKDVAEDVIRPLLAEVPAGSGYELVTHLIGSVRSLVASQSFASQSQKAMAAEDAQTGTWDLPPRRVKEQDDVPASKVSEVTSDLIHRTLVALRRYAQKGYAPIKPTVARLLRQNLAALTERLMLPGLLDDTQRRWLAEWCPTPSLLREVTSKDAHPGLYLFTVDNQQYVGVSVARDGLAHRCLNQHMNAVYRARPDQEKFLRYQAVKQDSTLKCYVVAQSHGGHTSHELELLETVIATLARAYTEEKMDTLMRDIGKFGADWTERRPGLNGTFPFVVNGSQEQLSAWGAAGARKAQANRKAKGRKHHFAEIHEDPERRKHRRAAINKGIQRHSQSHRQRSFFVGRTVKICAQGHSGYRTTATTQCPSLQFTFNSIRFALSKDELIQQLGSPEEAAKVNGTEAFVSVQFEASHPVFPGSKIGLHIKGKNWEMWFQRKTEIQCLKQLREQLVTAGLMGTIIDDLRDTLPQQLGTIDSGAEEGVSSEDEAGGEKVGRRSGREKLVADVYSREADRGSSRRKPIADLDSREELDYNDVAMIADLDSREELDYNDVAMITDVDSGEELDYDDVAMVADLDSAEDVDDEDDSDSGEDVDKIDSEDDFTDSAPSGGACHRLHLSTTRCRRLRLPLQRHANRFRGDGAAVGVELGHERDGNYSDYGWDYKTSEDEFLLETYYGESMEGDSDTSLHYDCGWSSESSDPEESVIPRKRRRADMSDESMAA
ncbi:hypothetical protein HDU86_002097 [Geranomyces michiganensis]|nr:hypothetical protein HDU86_002097 [Geranomyces michiganensis]